MRNIKIENTSNKQKYQPKTINSSNLNLFNVALVKHQKNNNNNDNNTYKLNNNTKNSENIISEKYSLKMMIEKYIDENSVIKPATNSLSASAKSKGTLFDSTNIAKLNITNNRTGNNTIDEKDVNDICAIVKQLLK